MQNPVLDPKINYASLINVNSSESGRTSSTVVPTSGSIYSSDNRQKIELLIPPISYLDAAASYLRFKVKIDATASSAVTGLTYLALDNVPACSVFESAILYNAENQVITEVRDFAALALHRVRSKGQSYQSTVAANAMGYSPAWNSLSSHADGDGTASGLYPILNGDSTATAGSSATNTGHPDFPGACRILSGATALDAAWNADNTVEFAVPLEYFSGVFGADKYLPLHLMGNRAHALRLDLTMNPAATAIVVCQRNSTNWAADIAKIQGSIKYTLSNIQMVVEYINVSEESDAIVRQAVNTTGVHYLYEDWTTKVDTGVLNQPFYTNLNPKYTISLKDVVCQFRDNSKVASFGQECVSGTRRLGLSKFQTKVGAMFYPNAPLEFNQKSYNGSGYLEWLKSGSSLTSKTMTPATPYWQTFDKAGFEVAVDYDKKEKDGAKDDYTFSGKDTRSGSSQIQILLNRDAALTVGAALENVHMTMLFGTDNVLVLQNGIAYPLERS